MDKPKPFILIPINHAHVRRVVREFMMGWTIAREYESLRGR